MSVILEDINASNLTHTPGTPFIAQNCFYWQTPTSRLVESVQISSFLKNREKNTRVRIFYRYILFYDR